jgi:AcrR family transcriptional regulator
VNKGAETRERILDHAFRAASRDGLDGISIGSLAAELGLSKSGLFAHFGSKQELQVELLKAAALRFESCVVRPALRAPRGVPRIRRLFDNWLAWLDDPQFPGGCIFVAAAAELDDREGRPRDALVAIQKQWLATLAKAARLAVESGHLKSALDCEQFAFELNGIVLSAQHGKRLLRDARAEARARQAFERLLAASVAPGYTAADLA